MSFLISAPVNAKAPTDAQDGCISFPTPVVNLLSTPLTLPVCGDTPISHRFLVSPLGKEKITELPAAGQHSGLAGSPACTPARISTSYAPVLTASPPFKATSHQSMPEISNSFVDVYPR